MSKKDYPIGTKLKTEIGETVFVEEMKKPLCTGCYFSNHQRRLRNLPEYSCYAHNLACTPYYRKDKKHVIFKPI